jgi:hypothetical protein
MFQDPRSTAPFIYEHYLELWRKNLVRDFPQHLYGGQISDEIGRIEFWCENYGCELLELSSPRPRLDRSKLIDLIGPSHVDELLELVETGDKENALKAARIIFAMAVLSRLDPDGDPGTTLLPPDLLRFYQGLPDCKTHGKTSHLLIHLTAVPSADKIEDPERALLLKDYWRTLTSLIYMGIPQTEVAENDIRRERARDLGAAIEDMLRPFIKNGQFKGNQGALENLIVHMAVQGFTLFSQTDPVTTGWQQGLWAEDKEDGQRKLVTFPAYYQNLWNRHMATGEIIDGKEMHQRSEPRFGEPLKLLPEDGAGEPASSAQGSLIKFAREMLSQTRR